MIPRVVISAPKGMSGKTIISLGIMYGLAKRGLKIAPFKIGPDYIDPSYHKVAAGRPGRNLDVMLMGVEGVKKRFVKYAAGSDVAIIEGVLGLYDSVDGVTETGSTAQVAKILKAPVILVLNGERVNRTLRAVVRGLKAFDPQVDIAGVVLTNVTPRQAEKLVKSIPEEGVEVVGVVPKSKKISEAFSYRHLGLVPVDERLDSSGIVEVLENYVLPHLDLDAVLSIAKRAGEVEADLSDESPKPLGCKIGVIMDRAFTFYYPELLEEAASLGHLIFLDSLRDQEVPPVDVVVVGGGFPEVMAEGLERNRPFRRALLKYIEGGGRLYAECGGLMYMTSSIIIDRSEYEMVGALDAVTVMLERPVGKGYAWGEVVGETPIAPVGARIIGHEFHYSKDNIERPKLAIRLERGVGVGAAGTAWLSGICTPSIYTYTPTHTTS